MVPDASALELLEATTHDLTASETHGCFGLSGLQLWAKSVVEAATMTKNPCMPDSVRISISHVREEGQPENPDS